MTWKSDHSVTAGRLGDVRGLYCGIQQVWGIGISRQKNKGGEGADVPFNVPRVYPVYPYCFMGILHSVAYGPRKRSPLK